MKGPLKLSAVRVNQGKETLYASSLPISALIDTAMFKVDEYSDEKEPKEQGYQRPRTERHASKIASYLAGTEKSHSNILPGAVLLNVRDGFDEVKEIGANAVSLSINDFPIFIVDGQHRVRGAEIALKERKIDNLADYHLPVVLSRFDHLVEAELFETVNSTAKRVDTALVQLLRRHFMHDEGVSYLGDPNLWSILATSTVLALKKEAGSPWKGRVQLANEMKIPAHAMKQNSFVQSLKPIYKTGTYQDMTSEEENLKAIKTFKDYWNALSELMPDAFGDPQNYVIQKTPGVFSLHGLLGKILRRQPDADKPFLKRALTAMMKSFETADGKKMTDDYWRKGKGNLGAEAAGSMKGFAMLELTMWMALKDNFDWK